MRQQDQPAGLARGQHGPDAAVERVRHPGRLVLDDQVRPTEAAHRGLAAGQATARASRCRRRCTRRRCPRSSAGAGSSRPRSSANLRNSSPAWRKHGRHEQHQATGPVQARRAGRAAPRPWSTCPPAGEQLSSDHLALERRTPACHASGTKPSRSRANATGSSACRSARARRPHACPAAHPPPSPRAPRPRPASRPGACPARPGAPPAAPPARRRAAPAVTATLPSPNMPRCCAEQPQGAQLVDRLQADACRRPRSRSARPRRRSPPPRRPARRGPQLHAARAPAHHPPRVAERDAGELENNPVGRDLGPPAALRLRLGDRGRNVSIRQQSRRRSSRADGRSSRRGSRPGWRSGRASIRTKRLCRSFRAHRRPAGRLCLSWNAIAAKASGLDASSATTSVMRGSRAVMRERTAVASRTIPTAFAAVGPGQRGHDLLSG